MNNIKRVLPSATEPLAKDIVAFIGGAPGKHAAIGGTKWWTPMRVLLAVGSFFLALAYMQKSPCLMPKVDASGQASLNWDGNRQYTAACYSDAIPLYNARGLNDLHFPYLYSWVEDGTTRYMEYPVLTGLHQWVAANIGKVVYQIWEVLHLPAIPEVFTYWAVNCFILSIAWLITIALFVKMTKNRVWDTVVIAASPLLIVHGFTNWDLLSVAACIGALYAWSKKSHAWAGVWIGIGIAFKLWPIFVLGALGLLCLRHRKITEMIRLVSGTVLSWMAVNLPIYLIAPQGWGEFFRMSSERGFEDSTLYIVWTDFAGWAFGTDSTAYKWLWTADHLNPLSMVQLLILLGGITWLVLFKAPVDATHPGPRVAQVAFLAAAAFLLTNKVWSPQFSIWLLPLIVLALPRWKLIFGWATLEAVFWYVRMWQFLPAEQVPPTFMVDALIVARFVVIGYMCYLIVRTMLGKIDDPVRDAHDGLDPLAGWDEKEPRQSSQGRPSKEEPGVVDEEKKNTQQADTEKSNA